MLDIQLLRTNIDAVTARLATRGYTLDAATFQKLEAERKTLQTRTQDLQASRNSLSKQIGQLKSKGEDASGVMAEVADLIIGIHLGFNVQVASRRRTHDGNSSASSGS